MANLKRPREVARGAYCAGHRRWRWLSRAPPVRIQSERNGANFFAPQVLPTVSVPAAIRGGNLERIRLMISHGGLLYCVKREFPRDIIVCRGERTSRTCVTPSRGVIVALWAVVV